MRELREYRSESQWFSQKASDVSRTLALSGLAVIWIFRETTQTGPNLPTAFFWPALLLVAALALDLLHYIVAAAIWSGFHRFHEIKGRKPTDLLLANPKLNWPTFIFFWGKVLAVMTAYCFLLEYLLRRLFAHG